MTTQHQLIQEAEVAKEVKIPGRSVTKFSYLRARDPASVGQHEYPWTIYSYSLAKRKLLLLEMLQEWGEGVAAAATVGRWLGKDPAK